MSIKLKDLKIIILAILFALFIRTFVFNIVIVNQTSMFPTLKDKDIIISNVYYKFKKNYKRGDIIVFKSNTDKKLLVKRIIGLPNENIKILDGTIYVDGKELKEPYLQGKPYTLSDQDYFFLDEDELFVLGDNRSPNGSFDSRHFGPIKTYSIRSKPIFRIIPIKSKKFINRR